MYRESVSRRSAAPRNVLSTVESIEAKMTAEAIIESMPMKLGNCHTLEYNRTVSFTFAFSPNIQSPIVLKLGSVGTYQTSQEYFSISHPIHLYRVRYRIRH